MKSVEFCGLTYELNENDFTAMVVGSEHSSGDIIIPRYIVHQQREYLITTIKKDSFKNNYTIRSISFPDDSSLLLIEEDSFVNSSIEELTIPKSLVELQDGWCNDTANLHDVFLSKENKHYKYLEETNNKIIVGQNKEENTNNINNINKMSEYNSIEFASRNIEYVTIPSFIQTIKSYSFSKCTKLQRIEISNESKLHEIKRGSFSYSSINKIFIPSHVKTIETGTFSWCSELKTVVFSENSELQKIEEKSFFDSAIESIVIPSTEVELNEGWCSNTLELVHVMISPGSQNVKYLDDKHKIIVGKTNKNSEQFDVVLFASRDIYDVFIPSFIKRIGSFAFSWCKNLQSFEFEENSQLISIGESAFSDSIISHLTIPKGVTDIKKATFWWCRNLDSIDFQDNSELLFIENNAFTFSTIKSLSIPSKVKNLEDGWCINTPELIRVYLSKENKNFKYLENSDDKIIIGKSNGDDFDSIFFACKNIRSATIPSFIKHINSHSFFGCSLLENISFSDDSQLISIGESAFVFAPINEMKIPKGVKKIQMKTFSKCINLKSIKFDEDSELLSIEKEAFLSSSIEELTIPKSLVELQDGWCNDTANLYDVFLSKENKHYKYLEETNNKIIIGQNKEENTNNINNINKKNEFNSIEFASRNIEYVTIPSFIQTIKSYSFSKCTKLQRIEISNESKLHEIKRGSFSYSSINKIFIPSHVKTIETNAFTRCKKLKRIKFDQNSELNKIEEYSFSVSTIENITIPKLIGGIGRGALSCCYDLQFFEFLGEELFIGHFCFNYCENLILVSFPNARKVSFSNDSLNSASIDLTVFILSGAKIISNF